MDLPFAMSIDPLPPIVPATVPTTTAAYAANPTSNPPHSFNHPPYADMIFEAIGALKERGGSSKKAIAKYIAGAYKDLPSAHSALLAHHLKRLKNSGQLVMVKKSYKLAARSITGYPDSSATASGPKRGRGRPPKPKPILDPDPASEPIAQPAMPFVAAGLDHGQNLHSPLALKRGPGRPPAEPRKQLAVDAGVPPAETKRRPGRPRKKPKSVAHVVGTNGLKRGAGRPPKLQPQRSVPIGAQPTVVPYFDEIPFVPNPPRPRGRPPKSAASSGEVGVTATGKRRGRPPMNGGVGRPMKPKTTTGTVGRPRKASASASASYGDIKRRLELFQSKLKHAVGLLKPQLTADSNISTVNAIRELEELSNMEIKEDV